jgi:hypothetical protein
LICHLKVLKNEEQIKPKHKQKEENNKGKESTKWKTKPTKCRKKKISVSRTWFFEGSIKLIKV